MKFFEYNGPVFVVICFIKVQIEIFLIFKSAFVAFKNI